jgi:hypothetical protein
MPRPDHTCCIDAGDARTRPRRWVTRRRVATRYRAGRRNVRQRDRHPQTPLSRHLPHTNSPSYPPTTHERRNQPCTCFHFRVSTPQRHRPSARWGSTPAASASSVAARSDPAVVNTIQPRRGAPARTPRRWAERRNKPLVGVTSRKRGPDTVRLQQSRRLGRGTRLPAPVLARNSLGGESRARANPHP